MPARVLPVRVAPLRGELFSSWFTRLAYANGEKVLGLASSLFGRNHGLFGGGDSDRGDRPRVIEGLSCATSLPVASIVETTLASYKGLLWDEVSSRGSRRWILPTVDRRHLHVLPGMQVCPACLREDAIPFHRKSWRVAFHVLCPDHGCTLVDRCAGCGQPLSAHRGDVGSFMPGEADSLTSCPSCGADHCEVDTGARFTEELVDHQWLLLTVLRRGWINVAGRVIYSTLFFEGLRMLWSFLDDFKRSEGVWEQLDRAGVAAASGTLRVHRFGGIEHLPVQDRYALLSATAWLLSEWPGRFVETLSVAGGSSDALLHFCRHRASMTPFWLWGPVHNGLDRTMYVPSDEEVRNAAQFLRCKGRLTNRELCKLLNLSTNHSARIARLCAETNEAPAGG